MTPTTPGPTSRPDPDDDLRALIGGAADRVEPADRLADLQARVSSGTRARRAGWAAPLAVAATIAAVAGVIGVAATVLGGDDDAPTASGSATSSAADPTSATSGPRPGSATPTPGLGVVPVYLVGDTPQGPRLFREFQVKGGPFDLVDAAVGRAVRGDALDPDYRTAWPAGTDATLVSATPDLITVSIEGPAALRERPSGTTAEQARLAVQQVVYSAQAASQRGRVPVRLELGGEPVDRLLGVPVAEPLANDPVLSTLALLNVSTPAQGQEVGATRLRVEGVANTFEGTVVLELLAGTQVLQQEPIIAAGAYGERLWPFEGVLDLRGLAPGDYTVRAWSEDASGEQAPLEDTKDVVVR